MGSNVFDLDDTPSIPEQEPEAPKRSKKRVEQLTSLEHRQGQVKLYTMVERAFETLNSAMEYADYSTAVKAAQILLDRTGFGPKSTVDVNTTHVDLSDLSEVQLAERAQKIAQMLSKRPIDITPTIEHQDLVVVKRVN